MQGYQGEAQNAQEKITALAIFCERIKFHTSYILYWERTFMIMKWVRVKDLQMSSFKWLLRFELYLSCAIVIWNLKIYIVVLFWHELWVEYVYVLTLSGNFK